MRIPVSKLGKKGERRAAWFYRLRGYRILGRNVRLHAGEIDLVARRGSTLVVAEVKTRQNLAAGEGHEAVNRDKQLRLIALADQYIAKTDARDVQIRYDVLSLFWNGYRFVVSHYPDAFRPMSDSRQPWKWTVA